MELKKFGYFIEAASALFQCRLFYFQIVNKQEIASFAISLVLNICRC